MRMSIVTGLGAAGFLAGCGQTGPLYLPDEGVQTPVEIRAPGTPAAAPEATQPPAATETDGEPEEKEEKDRHGEPPLGR